jgi:pyridoxamine 5'-phosphate oxidase
MSRGGYLPENGGFEHSSPIPAGALRTSPPFTPDQPTPAASARLAEMREVYARGGLDESDLARDWLTQFERWLDDAVVAGVSEPNAMVVATAAPDGRPSTRTVLLKGLDQRGFVFYTHYTSRKGREALANPSISLLFPWHPIQRQVIVTGRCEKVSDSESDAYFASRPRGSQLGALASPQSTVLASRAELEAAAANAIERFPDGVPVPRPATWGGIRVIPDAVEFWQGRPNRLHDRLRFRLESPGPPEHWIAERLAP